MTEEWSDALLRILAESTAETREQLLIDALTKRDAQAREWEQKARFWQHFYHESLRLFGDKQGPLKHLVSKAMTLLKDRCLIEATKEARPSPPPQGRPSGFNPTKMMEDIDRRKAAEWAKSYPAGKVVSNYIHMTYSPYSDPTVSEEDRSAIRRFEEVTGGVSEPIDREEAIRRIARAFGFPSYKAAYQFLKREGVKGLPSTWPK